MKENNELKTADNNDNQLVDWLYFLNDPESDRVKEIMKRNKEIKAAYDKLQKLSQDENFRRIAELRQKDITNEKARTMKEKGMPIELIVKSTGLSKEEIEAL